MIKSIIRKAGPFLGGALLCACESGDSGISNKTASLDYLNNRASYTVPYQASLLQNLPEQSIAYARIPELRGLVFGSQGSALQPAAAHDAIQQQWGLIIGGLQENVLAKIDNPGIRGLIDLLVSKQQAPIEMALIPGKAGVITPELLISTQIDYDSVQALTALLEQAVGLSNDQLSLTSAPDTQGQFALAAGEKVGLNGYFDPASKNLMLHAGIQVDRKVTDALLDENRQTRKDVYDFERSIDAAGKGFAIWVDTQILWQQFSSLMPVSQRQALEKLGLHEIAFAYAGNPSKEGHRSLTMLLQHSNPSENPLKISTPDQARDAKVSLPVELAATLPLPNREQIEQIMALVAAVSGDDSMTQAYQQAVASIREAHGVDLERALGAFGPGGVLVNDRAGLWAAVPIQDQSAFDDLITWTSEYLGAELKAQTVDGVEYSHYEFPNLTKMALSLTEDMSTDEQDQVAWLFALLEANNFHFYWHKEQSNLILGLVPQTLLARQRYLSNSTVNDWLQAHEINWQGGLLSLLVESEGLPRRIYRLQLSSLQRLSSIAGVDANLFSMPLAEDLQLPEQGRLGLQFSITAEQMRFQLDYEESLADYLFGTNAVAAVAVLGIVTAIAVPAYQDYSVRAQAAEALIATGPLKLALSEFYLTHGRFPDELEAEEYYQELPNATAWFDAEQQLIEILFDDDAGDLAWESLWIRPDIQDGSITGWQCLNQNLSASKVPQICRE